MTVIKYFAGGDFRLQIVTEIMMQREFQHIFQHRGLDIQGEPPTLAVSERYPIETHLPAVHVTVNIYRGVRQTLLHKIITGGETHPPLPRDINLTLHIQGVHHVMGVLVGVNQTIVQKVVVDAVGKCVIEGERPFLPILVCLPVLTTLFVVFLLAEGILVDTPVQRNAEIG